MGFLALILLDNSQSSCRFPDAQDAVTYIGVHLCSVMNMVICMGS